MADGHHISAPNKNVGLAETDALVDDLGVRATMNSASPYCSTFGCGGAFLRPRWRARADRAAPARVQATHGSARTGRSKQHGPGALTSRRLPRSQRLSRAGRWRRRSRRRCPLRCRTARTRMMVIWHTQPAPRLCSAQFTANRLARPYTLTASGFVVDPCDWLMTQSYAFMAGELEQQRAAEPRGDIGCRDCRGSRRRASGPAPSRYRPMHC